MRLGSEKLLPIAGEIPTFVMKSEPPVHHWTGLAEPFHKAFAQPWPSSDTTNGMFPMNVSAVSAPVTPPVNAPDNNNNPSKVADVQNGGAADGTRLPQPTVLAASPPGQGTRVNQLA